VAISKLVGSPADADLAGAVAGRGELAMGYLTWLRVFFPSPRWRWPSSPRRR
jgi:hypothetical protein